jgi:tripartite-type tricarboxylate transporter receptor subunit TctC
MTPDAAKTALSAGPVGWVERSEPHRGPREQRRGPIVSLGETHDGACHKEGPVLGFASLNRSYGPGIWFVASAFAAAAIFCTSPPPFAQDYPTRAVTLIVPYAAGGGNDAMARAMADRMGAALGGQIVIENRGGAGGSIATRQVARATPDGYTLGLGGTGTLAVDPTLYPNAGYDPRRDFAPVGLIATSAMVFLVNTQVPAATLKDFLALARSKPGRIDFASAGSGSGMHLGTELLAYMAGISMTHVPYKGSGPALTDLVGSHIDVYLSSLAPAVGLVREGKVRALAVTGLTRSKALPDIPTVAEAALPGFEAVLHYGIVAPAGTPRPIVDRLNAAMRTALSSPDVLARLDADGAEAFPSTPEQYAADIDREEAKWSEIVRRSGARAE